MKPIIFDNNLTTENIIPLMEKIHQSVHEEIKLYFSGTGMNITGEKMLVNFLNNLKANNAQIEIIAFNLLFGSAFNVFFRVNTSKKILKTTLGMIRLPHDVVGLREIRKEDSFKYRTSKKENADYIKWLMPIDFTEKEGRMIRTGKELKLDNGRLQDILVQYGNLLIEPLA